MHSSTVTVAVLGGARRGDDPASNRDPAAFSLEWYSGSGAGGQHRNKHCNSARITHLPTGLVRTAQTRSRENSRREAMEALERALDGMAADAAHSGANAVRSAQIGSGERSDKTRTFRFQAGEAIDHRTGRRARLADVMKGGFDLLA